MHKSKKIEIYFPKKWRSGSMGTHKIPRDVSGESRIFMIFSWKALAYTIAGAIIGIPLFLVVSKWSFLVGAFFIFIFALLGFSIGTFQVPDIDTFEITRKTAGMNIDEVIKKGIKFKLKGKKIYVYAKEEKRNDN